MTKPDPSAWWSTAITDMAPGRIALRGHPIEELIGNLSFAQMIWLMLRGDQPSAAQAELLECALVAGVDHGPQAPSIATARMAVTCGLGLNNALASAVNMLGDVHGGAGEQCAGLYLLVEQKINEGLALDQAASAALNNWRERHGKMVSGFGHRFHKPVDPRAPRLLQLVQAGERNGHCERALRRYRHSSAAAIRARRQAPGAEYRRRHCCYILRARICPTLGARAILPVAFGRHSGARLGTTATRWSQ